jgi:hypothetical protein
MLFHLALGLIGPLDLITDGLISWLSLSLWSACSFGWWLVLICSERKVLLAGCWWLVCSERKVLLAGG